MCQLLLLNQMLLQALLLRKRMLIVMETALGLLPWQVRMVRLVINTLLMEVQTIKVVELLVL